MMVVVMTKVMVRRTMGIGGAKGGDLRIGA